MLDPFFYTILTKSLYATNIESSIIAAKPADWSHISMFCFIGFLRMASIIYITIFPPSSGRIGSKLVKPSENDTTDKRFIKSNNPVSLCYKS